MPSCSERCHSFGLAIFNPKNKTCFGRTCKSWSLIFVYYVIFYSILAGFWIGMLSVLIYGILRDDKPNLTGEQSLLRLQPGLSFKPQSKVDSTLIHVTSFDSELKTKYLDEVTTMLSNYKPESSNCDFETGARKSGTVRDSCEFPTSLLGPCADPAAVLAKGETACFYLKMNKIYGYLPDIPDNKVLVECYPATQYEKEKLGEPVYYPSHSNENGTYGYFSSAPFPYLHQADYQTPLMAVTFPHMKKNSVIMVACKYVNLPNDEYLRFDITLDVAPSAEL